MLVRQILSLLKVEMHLQRCPEMDEQTHLRLRSYSWPGNVRELRNFLERSVIMSGGRRIDSAHLDPAEACPSDRCWTLSFPPQPSLEEVVRNLRHEMVLEGLRKSGGNRQAAARMLGISRYTLRRLLEGFGGNGRNST